MKIRLLVTTILLLLLFVLVPASALAANPTFDQAVGKLVTQGYPQSVEAYLNSLGTSPLGFRLGGTTAEHQASQYLAAQLCADGLSNVHLEAVPTDAWEVQGASVTVGSHVITASQIAGVPGTPRGGITGQVVYVHFGTAADYAGLDVKGKIVLVDHQLTSFWLDWPLKEATFQGAAAVILTTGPDSQGYATYAPDSLMGQDGEADASDVPLVFISRQDSDWLKGQLATGPVSSTMVSKVKTTMATKGGTGYNVFGEIPGSVKNGEKIIISAHQDAHLRPGIDDTGAVATVATIAKAMKVSGYHPRRTIVFMFTTSEEFGRQGTPYDWAIGAWYAITKTHPDWPGKVACMLNYELMAEQGGTLISFSPSDLTSWVQSNMDANAQFLPYGGFAMSPQSTISDAWSWAASGVPSVCFAAPGDTYIFSRYHTQYDNNPDFGYMGNIVKFSYRLVGQADKTFVPGSLSANAQSLADSVDAQALLDAGAKGTSVSNLTTAVARLNKAASTWDQTQARIPQSHQAAANAQVMTIEKNLLRAFAALDDNQQTTYPHQQVLRDVQGLNAAIAALGASDGATALNALSGVGITPMGQTFSYPVYLSKLARNAPNYPLLCWGGLGKLAPFLDVMPQTQLIENARYSDAASSLIAMRDSELAILNARLDAMTAAANRAATDIRSIR
jgi:N-acetylated-alpha-linked acidic dipeptidase